jgi:haloalkane dehalogenase
MRSPGGEEMVLQKNIFIEPILPASVIRTFTDEEMAAYRKPYLTPGERRRPMLTWPRQIPERQREVCRRWPNQREITVAGNHFLQEDSPHEIGAAIADWYRSL